MCHLNRLTLQIHNPLLTSFKCFRWPTLSPFLGKRVLRHCDMLWLQRLQFRILDRFSFFAHFEVPHCHHANHRYITDISCSATVPQVISKLRSRQLSSSMSSPFLQLNLTRSPNQGCCLHAMHGARTCLGLMPGTLLCFRHRWADVICCTLLRYT